MRPASLLANSSWLLASRLISVVLGGALSVYAIRSLSVGDWGEYSTVVSLVAIFGIVTEAGISSLTLREASSHPEQEAETLALAQGATGLTGALSLGLLILVSGALGYFDRAPLLLVGAGVLVCQAMTVPIFAMFNARRVLSFPAGLTILSALVATAVGASLIAAGLGPIGLLIGTLCAQLLAVAGGYRLLVTRFGYRPWLRRPTRQAVDFIRAALPIAATGGLAIIYQRLDILMLSKISGDRAVAIYSVPYSLVQYSWMLPQVVGAAYFPLLNQELRDDPEGARKSFFLIVRLFLMASVPVVLLLGVGAEPLLTTVFGNRYADSATVLTILAWASLLGFQSYVLWYVILASRLERRVVRYMFIGLLLNAAFNAVLIPTLGPKGAAAALVATDLFIILAQVRLVHREIFEVPWRGLTGRPLAAGALAAVAVLLLVPAGHLVAAVGGGVVYTAALLALRYVTWEEWEPLRAPLRRLRPGAS